MVWKIYLPNGQSGLNSQNDNCSKEVNKTSNKQNYQHGQNDQSCKNKQNDQN